MASLWFIMPAHGRAKLTRICLRQLRRTCDTLADYGIEATAVVIANDSNLTTARELGFGTIRRNNDFLGRKFNDGFQLACDPEYNPRPADHAMPIGSDDWIDHRLLLGLPAANQVVCFRHISLVSPDGKELSYRHADNPGGCGLRIYPRRILAKAGYRPADEDRNRGCDTSILANLLKETHFQPVYVDTDHRSIVDWKSSRNQVTPYDAVAWRAKEKLDPFEALAGCYPQVALEEMAARW